MQVDVDFYKVKFGRYLGLIHYSTVIFRPIPSALFRIKAVSDKYGAVVHMHQNGLCEFKIACDNETEVKNKTERFIKYMQKYGATMTLASTPNRIPIDKGAVRTKKGMKNTFLKKKKKKQQQEPSEKKKVKFSAPVDKKSKKLGARKVLSFPRKPKSKKKLAKPDVDSS